MENNNSIDILIRSYQGEIARLANEIVILRAEMALMQNKDAEEMALMQNEDVEEDK